MTENLIVIEPTDSVEPTVVEAVAPTFHAIFEDLQDVVFKLRAFTESREGDLGLGVELGMQRAADMLDNLLSRHQSDQGE